MQKRLKLKTGFNLKKKKKYGKIMLKCAFLMENKNQNAYPKLNIWIHMLNNKYVFKLGKYRLRHSKKKE